MLNINAMRCEMRIHANKYFPLSSLTNSLKECSRKFCKGSRKRKKFSLNGWAIKRGGGVKGRTFFPQRSNDPTAISSRGGGLGLNGQAIKTRTFFFDDFPNTTVFIVVLS